jgi:ferritin-like metal-binding protein YciE
MAMESAKAAGEAESKSPEQLQSEIEATREELGDTVAELADKADVKKQAKRKVADAKAKATAKQDELREKAAENPVRAAAIGAGVAGLLLGWIIARR